MRVSFVPLLIYGVTTPGNVGALSGRHVLKVPLSLTLVNVLAVGIQLALAPKMRMLLGMPRDWARSFCLAFPGRMSVVVVPLLAFLVTFLVAVVVGVLALALEERSPMAKHVSAKFLGVERVVGVIRVHVLVPDQPVLLVIGEGTPHH